MVLHKRLRYPPARTHFRLLSSYYTELQLLELFVRAFYCYHALDHLFTFPRNFFNNLSCAQCSEFLEANLLQYKTMQIAECPRRS
jgi:hypothetical protein